MDDNISCYEWMKMFFSTNGRKPLVKRMDNNVHCDVWTTKFFATNGKKTSLWTLTFAKCGRRYDSMVYFWLQKFWIEIDHFMGNGDVQKKLNLNVPAKKRIKGSPELIWITSFWWDTYKIYAIFKYYERKFGISMLFK